MVRGAGEGRAKVLQVARPGVGGVRVKKAFKVSYVALIAAILMVGVKCAGVELSRVLRPKVDDAAYGVGSRFESA